MNTPTGSVIGDPMYKEGDTVYVISKEKMASAKLEAPEDEAQLLDFFKMHADSVFEGKTDCPVFNGNAGNSSEPAGEKSK